MARRIRLKTKLVLAITAMMAAVVTLFSSIYLRQLIQHRIDDADEGARFVANQVFSATRTALEVDLSGTRVDPNDDAAVRDAMEETLQTDPGLNSLLQSIVGYAPTIYDVAIVSTDGHVLLHTDTTAFGKLSPRREDFAAVRKGGIRDQLRVVYGGAHVYEVRVPIDRDDRPFGEIRVGISTVFLKNELRPQLDHALIFSVIAILISMLLAAGLSNVALNPLTTIGRKLDLLSLGDMDTASEPTGGDEVGVVTHKIDRLGQQMRDVKDIFTSLKENVDQIMANLQDGLMLFTQDARVVLVSAAAERFLTIPRAEMLGRDATEIFSDETALGSTLLGCFAQHQPLPAREFINKNGEPILVSLDFIEEGGQRIGALLTLRDAESMRRIEDEIELSHRLASAGRLVSGVGHEVKNPINAIVVHLEVLRQKLKQVDPDTRRHMDVIGSEIQRLDRVVQLLVDFTRPVELRLSDVDLRGLVADVITLASPEAVRHGITMVADLGEDPAQVRVDADLLKQALLNVILNAVQAMAKPGEISVDIKHRAGEIVVSVRDQGAGIPADIRDKVYNLYFSTKKSGSGIGLAMTYKILQLMNGEIDFVTEIGHGTTFYLRLPVLGSGKELPKERSGKEAAVQA